MAPRKDASETAGIDSFDLPKTLVTRLAKSALPPEVKLQKDTVAVLVRGATVFINYLSATAQDIAAARSRRTIASADVLAALEVLAFGDLVPLLQRELDEYRGEKENRSKQGGKGKEVASVQEQAAGDDTNEDEFEAEAELEPENPEEDDVKEAEPEPEVEIEPENPEEDDDEERLEDEDVPSEVDMPDVDEADQEREVEELQDVVALEEEELRRDARGVEEQDPEE